MPVILEGTKDKFLDISDRLIVAGHSLRNQSVSHWDHQVSWSQVEKPCPTIDIYNSNVYDIAHSYNLTVNTALKIPECTHVLFYEDDMIIPKKNSLCDLMSFLESPFHKDYRKIVSGLYKRKQFPHQWYIMTMATMEDGIKKIGYPFISKEPPNDCAIKVGATATGFLLVKREVFEKMEEPYFVMNDPELMKGIDDPLKMATQDIYFSIKAKEAGFDLWVDCRVDLIHYAPTYLGREETIQHYIKGTGVQAQIERARQDFESYKHTKIDSTEKV